MRKTITHIHWPDAPDLWMPYAPAIKVSGGTTVYLAGVTAAPVYHHHPHRPQEFDAMPRDMGGQARAALGRHYAFRGVVVPGQQRGRDLGYPTLNLELESARKLLPPAGVYAVRAHAARGSFGGMMNLGPRPTFGEFDRRLEVHLFGATGDWYGEAVHVELVERLRDTTKFDSIEALVSQLGRDAEAARFALTQA